MDIFNMRAEFSTVIDTSQPVLVDFYIERCTDCERQVSILHEIVRYLGTRVRIIKIDIDKNRKVADKFGINRLPTLMLFRNGKLKWRQAGVVTEAGLIEVIFAAIK